MTGYRLHCHDSEPDIICHDSSPGWTWFAITPCVWHSLPLTRSQTEALSHPGIHRDSPSGPAAARAGRRRGAVRERSAAGSARAVHCGQGQPPPPPFCLCQARRGRCGRGGRVGVWRGGFGPQLTMISAAQLLDELMGRDRNLAPDEKRSNVRWDHESVSAAGPPLSSLLRWSRTLRGVGGFVGATWASSLGRAQPRAGGRRAGVRCRPEHGFRVVCRGAGRAFGAGPCMAAWSGPGPAVRGNSAGPERGGGGRSRHSRAVVGLQEGQPRCLGVCGGRLGPPAPPLTGAGVSRGLVVAEVSRRETQK